MIKNIGKKRRINTIVVAFLVLIAVVYVYFEIHIRDTLMNMIFENQFHHNVVLNSDDELDEKFFYSISLFNRDVKYHKGTECTGYRFYVISQPKIVHWFIGAECKYTYTYYSYDIGSDSHVDVRYAAIVIPVTVRLRFTNNTWEIVSYFEPA